MSRKNQDTWEFARRYWRTLNFRLSTVLCVLTLLIVTTLRNRPDFENRIATLVFLQLGILLPTIFPTKRALHRTFTRDWTRDCGPKACIA